MMAAARTTLRADALFPTHVMWNFRPWSTKIVAAVVLISRTGLRHRRERDEEHNNRGNKDFSGAHSFFLP
jgi:hypothetical protein